MQLIEKVDRMKWPQADWKHVKVCKGFLALVLENRTCEDACPVRKRAVQTCGFKDVPWTTHWIGVIFKRNESRHGRV
jgi:hypothetical protein